MHKYIYLSIFWFIFVSIHCYDDIIECNENSQTIFIKNGSYTLLQSPNFPESVSYNSSWSCSITFDTNDTSLFIWFGMLAGNVDLIQLQGGENYLNNLTATNYMSNFDTVTFSTGSPLLITVENYFSSPSWKAFQAAVIPCSSSDIIDERSPLYNQTFDFSQNPDLVIPVLANTEGGRVVFAWYFILGASQKLKVAIKSMSGSGFESFYLISDGKIIHNFTNDNAKHTYYFNGKNITIFYHSLELIYAEYQFFLLVSVVISNSTYTDHGCKPPVTTGLITTYTNIDYINGYPPYQRCENMVTVPDGCEAVLSIAEFDYESPSDSLVITDSFNKSIPITWSEKFPVQYILTSNVSGSQLTFNSDGNTQGAGYTVQLQTYDCSHANTLVDIKCGKKQKFYPLFDSLYYCSNQDQRYYIFPNFDCDIPYYNLRITSYLRSYIDNITIYVRPYEYFPIPSYISFYSRYFSSDLNPVLHFLSGPASSSISKAENFWFFEVWQPASFVMKTLNETNAKDVLWLPHLNENEPYIVCATNGTVEIFVTSFGYRDLSNYYLYDGKDQNNLVGSLDSIYLTSHSEEWLPRNAKSNSPCFTLVLQQKPSVIPAYSVLFKLVDDNATCQNKTTVFQTFYTSNVAFDAFLQSSDTESCEMIILASVENISILPRIWILNITTSPNSQFIFSSIINNENLVNLSSSDASEWKHFAIYTQALSINVPPSAKIVVRLSANDQILNAINVVESSTQKGIIASPSYSGFMETFDNCNLYTTSNETDFFVYFDIKEMYGNASVFLESKGKNYTLLQSKNLSTRSFALYYEGIDPAENGFFIEYTIIPNISTTTTKIPTTPKVADDGNKGKLAIIIICSVIGTILILVCIGIFIYRYLLRKREVKKIQELHQAHDEWELTWDKLMIKDDQLGSGAYGQVLHGKLLVSSNKNIYKRRKEEHINVAIKILQKFTEETFKKEFLNEIQMMKLITGHNHIIKMIGCITVGERICLVLEFCQFKDLVNYVKNFKVEQLEHAVKEFLIFAWQISRGMQYLASKGIIHRDLAARNILINSNKNAKIGDFGLCVQIEENSQTSNDVLILDAGRLPIKWLAIESLKNHEFSFKTDVWSFGIVLYEMYSFGKIPFEDIDTSKLLEYLEAENRPEKPVICPNEIYCLMLQCWSKSPSARPTFEELITTFTVLLEQATQVYGYLALIKSEEIDNIVLKDNE